MLIVKGMAKLGFRSLSILRGYFQQFGPVLEVLPANDPSKASATGPGARMRPAGMGYVLMRRAADAQRALAIGKTHVVNGVGISVLQFEHRGQRTSDNDPSCERPHICFQL